MQNLMIHKKSRHLKKYLRCNNEDNKKALYNGYKAYRNNLSTLMKQSKKHFYGNYSKSNINSVKNTWKGIKLIIFLKTRESDSPKTIFNS